MYSPGDKLRAGECSFERIIWLGVADLDVGGDIRVEGHGKQRRLVIPGETSHAAQLKDLEKRLAKVTAMTREQCTAKANRSYARELRAYNRNQRAAEKERSRLQKMHDRVAAWDIPTPDHADFKAELLDNLDDELMFAAPVLPPPKKLTGSAWRRSELSQLRAGITRREIDMVQAAEYEVKTRAWLDALQAVVPLDDIGNLFIRVK